MLKSITVFKTATFEYYFCSFCSSTTKNNSLALTQHQQMELAIENSCRICMLSACTLAGIFEEHDGKTISEMITEICGVRIEINDALSKKICKECESKTLELHAFRQLCVDSDETVRYNLLLADECDSVVESNDLISDETLKKVEGDEISQLEEYFIEDEESVGHSDFQQEDDDQNLEYDELFVNDDDEDEDGHHILADVESIDENSFDMTTERKNTVVIERVDTKTSTANSIIFEPSDDLTMKMREAHYAKEQQKKHKCPHCDKFFMFPSKGLFTF